jgi:hypothetical protein
MEVELLSPGMQYSGDSEIAFESVTSELPADSVRRSRTRAGKVYAGWLANRELSSAGRVKTQW